MKMEIIILAGGQAKRLRPITEDLPKCMVPINGKPTLDYHLSFLRKNKQIDKIVLACGYRWDMIKEHYGNQFIYSVEDAPRGTAGAVKLALDHIEGEEFLVLNADDINNVDIPRLIRMGGNATVICRFKSQFGIVDIDNGHIRRFREKPLLPYWANLGMHILTKNVKFPETGSLEQDVLPKLASRGQLKAFKHTGYWVTINTLKELEEAGEMLKKLNL